MSKYIVKIRDNTGYAYFIGDGGTYQFQGEKYAVIVESAREAKRYTSLTRAKNAFEKLFESCVNVRGTVEFMEVDQ